MDARRSRQALRGWSDRSLRCAPCWRASNLYSTVVWRDDVCMRTTLTLDDDIAAALRERARAPNRTFERVVNDAFRRGMSRASPGDLPPYRLTANRSGLSPGIDTLRLNHPSQVARQGQFPRGRPHSPSFLQYAQLGRLDGFARSQATSISASSKSPPLNRRGSLVASASA